MHLKRQKVPKSWPIKRKGTKYIVRPNSDINKGIPILIILRDLMKVAQNRREVKIAIHQKNLLLNNKKIKDDKSSAALFDVLSLVPSKKSYRIVLSDKGKFNVQEIKENEKNQKISKVINKKTLKKKRTQLNLSDGNNFITDIKCNVGDSVVIDFEKNNVNKVLPLKENSNVIIFAGNHVSEKGIINKIDKKMKMVELQLEDKIVNILIKQIMVVE